MSTTTQYDQREGYVLGGDISFWQGICDLIKAFLHGWKYVYIKASQGNFADSKYKINRQRAKEAGLKHGAYHFLVWNISPEIQADFFWNTIKDDPGELPPICDFEWNPGAITPAHAFDYLYRFMARMIIHTKGTNIKLGIYSVSGFWNEAKNAIPEYSKRKIADSTYWQQFILWIASPGRIPPVPFGPFKEWHIWQWNWKGDGPYYGTTTSKNVDLNWIPVEKYYQLLNTPIPEEPKPPEPPQPPKEDDDYMLKMKVIVNVLNVRHGPGTAYNPPVRQLKKDEIITVYNVKGVAGSWVQIDPILDEWCCVENSAGVYLQKIQ
jgi:GH25 family lysozyme M1 (1,4-beta-N-acetylmuramidase)